MDRNLSLHQEHSVPNTSSHMDLESSEREHKRGIKWDEEVIKEHDKERGTRMKINEPKTPYNYLDPEGEQEEDVKVNTDQVLGGVSSELEKIKKKHDFENKRKEHYNEFFRVKQMRDQLKSEEELDEDEKFEDP